jgi:hypothetical protein
MSLIATRVQNWRVQNPAFDKNMTRPQEYGALDFFISQTNAGNSMISPDLRARALASIGTTVQIPVINFDENVQVSNVRTCIIADNENTSALYTVVFATFAVGFTMVPTMYMNNEISYNHDWTRKMEKITRGLANALDIGAVTALEANKTQVFKDLLYYTQVGNDVQVPWDLREVVLSDSNTMMRANAYPGLLHVIGNAGIDSMLRQLAKHGLYNDEMKRMEYENKVIHYTNNIVNEAGKFATAFVVEDGNVGMLTRVDREAMRGGAAQGHEWDIVRLPYIDLPVGSHFYTSVGDMSGIGGASTVDMTCVVKEHYGFSVDVAYLVAYNSNPATIANPIIKLEIAQSNALNPVARPVTIVNGNLNPVYTKVATP